MDAKPVAAKLGIRPAQSVFVINPPGNYETLVGGLPPGTTVVRHRPADVVWISYPKNGASELKRDMLRDAINGWQPVSQVAIDDTWSAMRFRPDAEVGTR